MAQHDMFMYCGYDNLSNVVVFNIPQMNIFIRVYHHKYLRDYITMCHGHRITSSRYTLQEGGVFKYIRGWSEKFTA